MEKLIVCKSCGNQISKKTKMCPNCGSKNKKIFWWLIVPLLVIACLVMWSFISQITQGISETPKQERDALLRGIAPVVKVYTIGEKGPAGGIIFYDKGDSYSGWRYLEAAPPETEFVNAEWGTYGWTFEGTHDEIGTGEQNTHRIIRALQNNDINETGKIAQLVNQLNFNGYTDWFLPSKDELYWMYHNLAQRGLGGFAQERYWSSTLYDGSSAWYLHFGDNGRSSHNYDKRRRGAFFTTGELRARAIRSF